MITDYTCPYCVLTLRERHVSITSAISSYSCYGCNRIYVITYPDSATEVETLNEIHNPDWYNNGDATQYYD